MTPASIKAKKTQVIGQKSEQLVINHLHCLGIPAEKIETHFNHKLGIYSRKALADIVGCLRPSGRMILVEVKHTEAHDNVLPYGRLSPHQWANLATWSSSGALSLVGWVRGIEPVLMPWDAAPGWCKKHPLPWATAKALAWTHEQSPPGRDEPNPS